MQRGTQTPWEEGSCPGTGRETLSGTAGFFQPAPPAHSLLSLFALVLHHMPSMGLASTDKAQLLL